MSTEKQKPHLSASSLELFAKCPEAWRRRYIENEKIPPRLSMHKGKALHAGAELNMRQKIETREDLEPALVAEFAVQTFRDSVKHDGYELSKNESAKTVDSMTRSVEQLTTVHMTEQAPAYQPTAVEKRFKIELPSLAHDLVGVIDLETEASEVVDFKSARRAYAGTEADHSPQLTIYAASQAAIVDQPITVKLDVVIEPSARKPARRQLIESTRDKSDLPIIGRRLAVVSRTIEAGLFPPASVGSWWCSESWCGYWHSCPYVNSERIQAARSIDQAIQVLTGESD